ncbi:MAG: hypothetical protein WAN74_07840 [Thermoplasmata archaeon]
MNRFDREYWDGAREVALVVFNRVNERADVPADVKVLARTLLRETAERKNRDFREAVGLAVPELA